MEETTYIWLAVAILPVLAAVMFLVGISTVCRLSRERDQAWEAVKRFLKERYRETPELTSVASLYIPWSDPLIADVKDGRRLAMAARTMTERVHAEAELSWALARLMVAVEGHPQLKRHADLAAILSRISETDGTLSRLQADYNRRAVVLEDALGHFWNKAAGSVTGIRASDPFDLDPQLARQAMMVSIQNGQIDIALPV